MNKHLPILFTSLIAISGCSESTDTATQDTSAGTTATTEKAAPKKMSADNPFASQVDALNAAKAAGSAAQKSIDSNQQKLEDVKGY